MEESDSHLSSLIAECKQVSDIYQKMQSQNNHRLSKIALFISNIDDFRSLCESGCKWIMKESSSRRTEIETSVSSNAGKVLDLNTTLGLIESEVAVILQRRMGWIQTFVCRVEATHEKLENIYSEISNLAMEEMEKESTKLSAFYKEFYVQKTKYLKLMPAQLSVPSSSSSSNTSGRRVTRSLSSSDPGTFKRCRDTLQTSFDKIFNEDGVSNTDVDLVSPERAKVKGCVNNGTLNNQSGDNNADNHNQHDNPDESVHRIHHEPITLINDSDSDSDSDFKVPIIVLNHSATRTSIAERNRLELAAEISRKMDSVVEDVDRKAAHFVSSQTIDDVEPLAYTPLSTVVLTDSEESTAEQVIYPEINEGAEFINIDIELKDNASTICRDKSVNSSTQVHESPNESATHTSTSTTSNQERSIEVATDSAPLKNNLTSVKPIAAAAAAAAAATAAPGPVPIRKSPLSSMTSSLNTLSTDNIPELTAQRPAPRIPVKILPPTSSYSRARSNSSSSNNKSSSSSSSGTISSSSSNTDKSVTEGMPSGNPSSSSAIPLNGMSSGASNGGNGCLQMDVTDKASSTKAVSDTSMSPSVAVIQAAKVSLKRTNSESAAPTDATSSRKTHKQPSHGSNIQTNKIDLTDDS